MVSGGWYCLVGELAEGCGSCCAHKEVEDVVPVRVVVAKVGR